MKIVPEKKEGIMCSSKDNYDDDWWVTPVWLVVTITSIIILIIKFFNLMMYIYLNLTTT